MLQYTIYFFLFLFGSIGVIRAEDVALIPREILFGSPEKATPKISPDGKKLCYVAPDENKVMNIWLRDLSADSKNPDVMITSDTKRGIWKFLWQYDNEHLLYIQDKQGDENWHLHQIDIQTKISRELTPYDGVQANILDYNADFPDEILVCLNLKNPSLFDVYRINLKDGTMMLDTENKNSEVDWLADSKLKVRASQTCAADGSAVFQIRDDEKSPWRNLLTIGPEEGFPSLISFSKDGKFLYMITNQNSDTACLVKINLATNEKEIVFQDPHYDVSHIMINPVSYEIDSVGVNRDIFEWIALQPEILSDFKLLQQEGAVFTVSSHDLTGGKWIVTYNFDNKPPQLYLFDRTTKQKQFLFTTRPKLTQYTLCKMKPISYKARDGMTIHAYLTLPDGKEANALPSILLVHGGPNDRDSWGYDACAQWLVNRGYAVLQINYRGSTGYGKTYLNAGNKEWGAKMQDDLLDGKQWLIKQGYADPNKVAIFGGSYGGYAALVGVSFTPQEFCCAVDIVGPSNLVTMLKNIPAYWEPLKVTEAIRIGNIDTEVEFLQSRSPLFKAHQIVKPLLIAQGANDPRVKQAESDQIVQAIRQNNKTVEYLLFKDEGHGFARHENQLKFYACAEQFLSKYLGGRVEMPAESENWESLRK